MYFQRGIGAPFVRGNKPVEEPIAARKKRDDCRFLARSSSLGENGVLLIKNIPEGNEKRLHLFRVLTEELSEIKVKATEGRSGPARTSAIRYRLLELHSRYALISLKKSLVSQRADRTGRKAV
jgi:hypothetical protein